MYIGHQYIFCHLNTNRQFCDFSSALNPAYGTWIPSWLANHECNVWCLPHSISHLACHVRISSLYVWLLTSFHFDSLSSSSQITYTLSSMYMLSVGLTAIMHGFDDQYGSYNVQCTFFASNELPSVFCHNIYLPMNLLYITSLTRFSKDNSVCATPPVRCSSQVKAGFTWVSSISETLCSLEWWNLWPRLACHSTILQRHDL